jgi:thiamine biosynthesis lipoprotein
VLSEKNNNDILIDISECVFSEIQRIENLMSFHDPDSELSYINREAYNHSCSISKDMKEVLVAALHLSKVTNGIYDISIAPTLVRNGILPDQSIDVDDQANWQDISIIKGKISFKRKLLIDLGGIAKGYAVDRALCMVENQVKNITVNAGGDLRIKEWSGESVGIKASDTKGFNSLIFVPMHQAALATSSNYYIDVNKSAMIDPFTKKELKDKKSISVFAPNCMLADALTKVAFLDITLIPIFKPLGVKAISIDESGNVQDLCERLEHG